MRVSVLASVRPALPRTDTLHNMFGFGLRSNSRVRARHAWHARYATVCTTAGMVSAPGFPRPVPACRPRPCSLLLSPSVASLSGAAVVALAVFRAVCRVPLGARIFSRCFFIDFFLGWRCVLWSPPTRPHCLLCTRSVRCIRVWGTLRGFGLWARAAWCILRLPRLPTPYRVPGVLHLLLLHPVHRQASQVPLSLPTRLSGSRGGGAGWGGWGRGRPAVLLDTPFCSNRWGRARCEHDARHIALCQGCWREPLPPCPGASPHGRTVCCGHARCEANGCGLHCVV